MSPKVVTILGATGIQGGSVVNTLLKDKTYNIRAVTRNPQSPNAQKLAAEGVTIVQADLDDYDSLVKAFVGSHIIYAVTNFYENFGTNGIEGAIEMDARQGISLAKAAAATETLEHYIWSTLPNSVKVSGGKHRVPQSTGKNKADEFIKSNKELYEKTTFLWVSLYSSSINFPFFSPFRVPTAAKPDQFVQLISMPPSSSLKTIGDARHNVGLFVQRIIDQPELTRGGRFVLADLEDITTGEWLSRWSKGQGKEASYVQVEKSIYFKLWPVYGEAITLFMEYWQEYGRESWSGEPGLLTAKELGVSGLVGSVDAFSEMTDWS